MMISAGWYYPGRYLDGLLRTVQRGLSRWAFLLVKGADSAHSGLRVFQRLRGLAGHSPEP
jgi:hypothetical protein